MSCPAHCKIEQGHVHERDNEWPHMSAAAHRGFVEVSMDDGHVGAWLTLDPETAVCAAYELIEAAEAAMQQPKGKRFGTVR